MTVTLRHLNILVYFVPMCQTAFEFILEHQKLIINQKQARVVTTGGILKDYERQIKINWSFFHVASSVR